MGPRPHLWFSVCKTACLASESLVSMGPSPHLCSCIQNSDFWTRITNLYGSQTSPVVLCRQYSVISTCFYGSQPLSVVFACITTTFGPEYKSLWVPDLTCRFCMQNSAFWIRKKSLYGFQIWLIVLCMYSSVLSNRITSLYGSPPSSVVLIAKQRLLGQNYKSLLVPVVTCRFVQAICRDEHQNYKSILVPDPTCHFVYAKQGD